MLTGEGGFQEEGAAAAVGGRWWETDTLTPSRSVDRTEAKCLVEGSGVTNTLADLCELCLPSSTFIIISKPPCVGGVQPPAPPDQRPVSVSGSFCPASWPPPQLHLCPPLSYPTPSPPQEDGKSAKNLHRCFRQRGLPSCPFRSLYPAHHWEIEGL